MQGRQHHHPHRGGGQQPAGAALHRAAGGRVQGRGDGQAPGHLHLHPHPAGGPHHHWAWPPPVYAAPSRERQKECPRYAHKNGKDDHYKTYLHFNTYLEYQEVQTKKKHLSYYSYTIHKPAVTSQEICAWKTFHREPSLQILPS